MIMFRGWSKYVMLFLIVILLTSVLSFSVDAKKQPPTSISLDAIIQPEKSVLEMDESGITEGNMLINLLPNGIAEINSRKGIDVVFVFDKSNSMNEIVDGQTKIKYAKEAVDSATTIFKENGEKGRERDRFGLVPFDTDVEMANAIEALKNNPKLVSINVDRLEGNGGTNYTQALEKAREILMEDSNKNNGNPVEDRDKYIIFLTDGIPTNSQKELYLQGDFREISYLGEKLGEWYDLIYGDRITLSENKNVYFDNNPGRGYAFFGHTKDSRMRTYQFIDPYNVSVDESIRKHVREQVHLLAQNDIILYSIGFGSNNEIDMDFLTELSAITNGKAVRANEDNILEYFEKISQNLSSEYPTLSGGYLTFTLPENVMVEESDDLNKIGNKVVYNLNDIPFNPYPPGDNNSLLHYKLPLKFLKEGTYSFSFDIVFNGGAFEVNNIPATIEVKKKDIPLESIDFMNETQKIYVGERIKLEEYLTYNPYNASNKMIKKVLPGGSQFIDIVKIDNEWWVIGKREGVEEITAIAQEKTDNNLDISAQIVIFVIDRENENERNPGQPGIPDNPGEPSGPEYRW